MPKFTPLPLTMCFFVRLIAFIILRLHYLGRGIHSPNPTLDLVGAVVWGEIELHYSVLAVTIPCLRPFMMAVSTDYGATEPRPALGSRAYGSSGGSANKLGSSYVLNSMGSGQRSRMNSENNPSMFHKARMGASRLTSNDSIFRTHRSQNKSVIASQEGNHDSGSIESNDSRRMIIKKEIDFKVERDAAPAGDEQMGNRTNGHHQHHGSAM